MDQFTVPYAGAAGLNLRAGHVWATTSTGDGSEADQVLLVPKGWGGYFHYPFRTS